MRTSDVWALRSVSGGRQDLPGADLSGANLRGIELAGGGDLSRADLRGADLTGAELTEVDLSEANFVNADLSGAKLTNCKLDRVNMSYANLHYAVIYECSFIEVQGQEMQAEGSRWIDCNLVGMDLSGANLAKCFMSKVNLSKAHVWRTYFSQASIIEPNITGVDFMNTYLLDCWWEAGEPSNVPKGWIYEDPEDWLAGEGGLRVDPEYIVSLQVAGGIDLAWSESLCKDHPDNSPHELSSIIAALGRVSCKDLAQAKSSSRVHGVGT